jgi:integrase
MDVQDFLSYIREAKSKATCRAYVIGLEKFTEWYGKSANKILKERFQDLQSTDMNVRKRFNREIEKFHRWLRKRGYPQNTAVTYVQGIRQLFRFFDMDVKDLPSEVTRRVTTVKDYVPTVKEYRDMFNCGNILDRVIISMALDLGWRIGDFITLRKDMLPNLEQGTPIPFSLITEKEEVVAKSFLSAQTVQLLKTYLKTLPEDNPYLFPNGNGSHLDAESINKRLKVLAKKSNVRIPKGKRLRFHCFRKRFLSECANLKIDINTAKILVGKSVSKDMLTYLSEVEHKKAFEEVHRRLQMSEVKAVVNAKDAEIEALKKRIEELEIMNKGLIEMLAKQPQIVGISGDEETAKATIIERIKRLGKEAIEKEKEEYKKLIESNNNNNK